ncbi:HesA/MoeB/ThiF family protein [Acidianus infernus]|uniref:HesA/MoeB/ThiF family protein n=1 Tax=Acidianus infernus TaxID=12915 RepID=A0A6A9QAX8_ACIIN|nr:HesA/MoeB/ThiF family protein [Acidianus infernus]MCY0873689.1 HesA/MoeB/ThiF family protein [Acidianus infernus]MUM64059.1 HesA/MoeB/ThiF family protein [Acidianus infernus]
MDRFSRQLLALGIDVQEKIMSTKVLIVGCGALGSSIAELLVRLGVKELKIVDADVVELSNLHRTHIFTEKDLMKPKVLACKEFLEKINSEVKIEPIFDIIDETNAENLVKDVDVVFDGLDNINYRLILNDACVKYEKPLIYAGISGEYGNAKLVIPGKTSCLACFLQPSDSRNACDIIGTTTVVPNFLASIQVQLFINYLRGYSEDELVIADLKDLRLDKIKMKRNPQCEACSLHEYKYLRRMDINCGLTRAEKAEGDRIFSSNGVELYKYNGSYIICYNQKCFKKRIA